MIAYILTHLWVFMEMLFLDILADAFLIKKKSGSRSKRVFGLLFLTMVMSVSVTLFEDIVALKLFFDFLIPSVTPFENPEVMAMYSASSRVPVCPVITILG